MTCKCYLLKCSNSSVVHYFSEAAKELRPVFLRSLWIRGAASVILWCETRYCTVFKSNQRAEITVFEIEPFKSTSHRDTLLFVMEDYQTIVWCNIKREKYHLWWSTAQFNKYRFYIYIKHHNKQTDKTGNCTTVLWVIEERAICFCI